MNTIKPPVAFALNESINRLKPPSLNRFLHRFVPRQLRPSSGPPSVFFSRLLSKFLSLSGAPASCFALCLINLLLHHRSGESRDSLIPHLRPTETVLHINTQDQGAVTIHHLRHRSILDSIKQFTGIRGYQTGPTSGYSTC